MKDWKWDEFPVGSMGLVVLGVLLLFLACGLGASQQSLWKGDSFFGEMEGEHWGSENNLDDLDNLWVELQEEGTGEARVSPVVGWDSAQEIQLLRGDGRVEQMSLEAYLWGVLAAEMPASFPLEALKAQVVAARTYTALRLERSASGHGLGVVCDDSSCCQAYVDVEERIASWGEGAEVYGEKIALAVAETDGLFVMYQEEFIDAVFFSSSAGETLTALEVWGNDLPYLQSVFSPEGADVPNYDTVVEYGIEDLRGILEGAYPTVDLHPEGEQWFLNPVYGSGGAVGQYLVGGVTLTGLQLRSVLGLRSVVFTVSYGDGVFRFDVRGYGHGVGLSQYGAKALAEEGMGFDEILCWYYQGTEVGGWQAH